MAGTSPSMPCTDYGALTLSKLPITDYTLDENLPELAAPPSTQPHYYTSQPSASLGSLGRLPIELLQMTLCLLDLRTLMEFRRVNQQSLQLVEALPQYKAIASHALGALRGALSTGMGQWITCQDLFDALCTAECKECGDFAGYIFLLTCTRVCFMCFAQNENYLPLRYAHAKNQFGLSRQMVTRLPHMRSLSGTYTLFKNKFNSRITLIDFASARAAGIALDESLATMERDASESGRPSIPAPSRSGTEAPFDSKVGNPLRFMAIVRVPWFNRASKDVEWGFYCIGCQKSCCWVRHWPMHFRRKFSVALFDKHLIQCGSIKDGKHQPD